MSYTILLRSPPCSSCGRFDQYADWTPTANLGPIFDLAFAAASIPRSRRPAYVVRRSRHVEGLYRLHGRAARETCVDLESAVARLTDERLNEQFIAREPANRWGTRRDALDVLRRMQGAATAHPDGVWDIR